ncbi:hypothetical protein AX14_006560 [Amanita brunnescens Koide BX004]|nr:hypothetical protein AX14_006560 [Amanita brunnescens Koide BX004]
MARGKRQAQAPQDPASLVLPPSLYLGPRSAASSKLFLMENSITHVLSIGANPSKKFDGVTYYRLSISDSISAPISKIIDPACEIIDEAIASKKGTGKILVHCAAGISRSPMLVTAYLMKRKGMTLKAALGQIVRVRPQISPNTGFLQQLKEMEIELYGSCSLKADEMPKREKERLALFEEPKERLALFEEPKEQPIEQPKEQPKVALVSTKTDADYSTIRTTLRASEIMAFSSAHDFDILDSEFTDVAGNYNHQITTSIPQVIGGSTSNSRETNEPYLAGLSQSSNVAGNQINNVITYITIVPDSSRSVTPTYISSASYIPDSHQHASGSATLTGLKNGTTFPGGPNGSEIVAIALHNFHAREDDEITFVKGERIEQIDKLGQDAKWWAGLAPRGKWGLFPANYVKIIKNLQEGMTGIAAVALYGFDPNEDNELSFVEGDLIEHIYKVNGNWLGGFGPGGTWGLFPGEMFSLLQ